MSYLITVHKITPNEEYEDQLKEWEERNRYQKRWDDERPTKTKKVEALQAELTNDQFNRMRSAVIKEI